MRMILCRCESRSSYPLSLKMAHHDVENGEMGPMNFQALQKILSEPLGERGSYLTAAESSANGCLS